MVKEMRVQLEVAQLGSYELCCRAAVMVKLVGVCPLEVRVKFGMVRSVD